MAITKLTITCSCKQDLLIEADLDGLGDTPLNAERKDDNILGKIVCPSCKKESLVKLPKEKVEKAEQFNKEEEEQEAPAEETPEEVSAEELEPKTDAEQAKLIPNEEK